MHETADETLNDRIAQERRSRRYRFESTSLAECKALRIWLEQIGAGRRDTLYVALVEHIAAREQREARGRAMGRRARREGVHA